jgi:transcriptional regulator with XRE-family HTH domain
MERKENRLQELREAAGVKRHELAVELDVDPSTVYRWEIGRTSIPSDLIPRLAARFGVEPAHLMGWDRKAAPETAKAA